MPKSKASKRRIDKYAGNSPQLRDSGFLVKLGGVFLAVDIEVFHDHAIRFVDVEVG